MRVNVGTAQEEWNGVVNGSLSGVHKDAERRWLRTASRTVTCRNMGGVRATL